MKKLKAWELALLMALCITFCAGMWADRTQNTLSDGLIRLHVVANSDSPADQAEKLRLRDRALELLAPLLRSCETRQEALDVISARMSELEALGAEAELGREYYPTRRYSTFTLPAGEYVSLRLTLGEGAGHNWWCVVFPPLCTEVLAEEDASDAFLSLDRESADLIAGGSREYDLRFRIVDWWGELREKLSS